MRDVFIERLTALAERDPRIMLITGDLGFGVLTKFEERFPRQYLNAGIAEQNMTGLATGLALEGRIVFTYSIGNFPTLRCLEQIRNDAAYHGANVNVVSVGGGFSYGALGVSHHATEDLSIMRAIPGVTVVSPGCDWEVAEAVPAIVALPGTTYLRLDKSSAGFTRRDGETFELGRARRVRDGDAATIVATGGILGIVLSAADQLADSGIRCRVLSMHTIKPFDANAICSAARETGGIVTVEEHVIEGGLGSAVAEALLDNGVAPRASARLGLRGGFATVVGSQQYLRSAYQMAESDIVGAVRHVSGC
ncbi:MAG TPA: transketolase C-terminal domain-containing protein [Gemmatimonadaceae bacterium]|nr:transketolase C-terminal domain-containing protein [Gemmatimonadaceae bacterium]